ncbi:MAG: GNAT family N-acetyltransferase [Bacteroidales bacterium]|nr:GNAT family N-acetyltransferase [Bacteroidales bacterium]
MKIIRYTSQMKNQWDTFIKGSKNGTFLFMRDYMDYHSNRFDDCSFLFYENDRLCAVLAGNLSKNEDQSLTFYTHQGLTYGGFILHKKSRAELPLLLMEELIKYLKNINVALFYYKAIPHIYHKFPAEEDIYSLFINKFSLLSCNISTAVRINKNIDSSRLFRAPKRKEKNNLVIEQTNDASLFWDIIVNDRKERHNVSPVHTLKEIQLLKDRFPDNIFFHIVKKDDEIIAGSVIYFTEEVIHLQYAAATNFGKSLYATDIIYYESIFNFFPNAEWFDFGISNENNGLYLNTGMTNHKEEFGASSVVYNTYFLSLDYDKIS